MNLYKNLLPGLVWVLVSFAILNSTSGETQMGYLIAWGNHPDIPPRWVNPNPDYQQIIVPENLDSIVSFTVHDNCVIAVKENGQVVTWGESTSGLLNIPSGLSNVKSIVTAGDSVGEFAIALENDGSLIFWGDEGWYNENLIPDGLSSVKTIKAGSFHVLALKDDGAVVAWGSGGIESLGQDNVPQDLGNVADVAGGAYFSAALKKDGTVTMWGDTAGIPFPESSELNDIIEIEAGRYQLIALKSDQSVEVWGGGQTDFPEGLSGVVDIAAYQGSSVALKQDGSLVFWGEEPTIDLNPKVLLTNVIDIQMGQDVMFALINGPVPSVPSTWGNYPIVDGQFINASGWLGWLDIEQAPYVWSYSLGNWIYMEEPTDDSNGAWIYCFK